MHYQKLRRCGAPLAAALLAACAGNGDGLNGNGQPSAPGTAPATPLAANFQSIQDNVFTPICVHCHSGAAAPQGLQLDAAHSYALLVGVPSAESSGLDRVQPSDPDHSYLVLKLQGSSGIVGARMPLGGPYLPQSTIDIIRQWITDGALDSGPPSANSDFALAATSPPNHAAVPVSAGPLVAAFNHEVDFSLVNDTTLYLERVTPEGAERWPGGSTFTLARGNPRAVLLTPALPLTPGTYRLRLRGLGPAALADVNAQPLGSDYVSEFTVAEAR